MQKIFDVHTHIYPEKIADKAVDALEKFYNFKTDGNGTAEDYEYSASKAGVSGMIYLGVATNSAQVEKVNSFLAEKVKSARERGFEAHGFFGMHQDYPDFESEVKRCVEMGLDGLKIHPDIQRVDIDDKRYFPLYEMMQSLDLPITFHMGDDRPEYRFSSPAKLAAVLGNFPRLRVSASHFGAYHNIPEALEYLSGRENVMYDTSNCLHEIPVECAMSLFEKMGFENFMFGTDYPSKYAADELTRFDRLPLSPKQREDILYNNAKRYLKI